MKKKRLRSKETTWSESKESKKEVQQELSETSVNNKSKKTTKKFLSKASKLLQDSLLTNFETVSNDNKTQYINSNFTTNISIKAKDDPIGFINAHFPIVYSDKKTLYPNFINSIIKKNTNKNFYLIDQVGESETDKINYNLKTQLKWKNIDNTVASDSQGMLF